MDSQWNLQIDSERAWQHVRRLTEDMPGRYTGTKECEQAAEYIATELHHAKVDEVEIENYPGYGTFISPGSVEVLAPEHIFINCETVGYSLSTEAQGLTAEFVDIGPGWEADWRKYDLTGKAVLSNAWEGPGTPEKARLAAEHGAIALVLVTWPAPEANVCTFRAFKGVWGNPDRESMHTIPSIVAVTISYSDGVHLRTLLRGQNVQGRIYAQATREWVTLHQPIATVRAAQPTEDFILVAGHLDVWRPGVTDNATGVALMLEMARSLTARQKDLKRNIVFAFWDGHEVLEATGSSCFLEKHWDAVREHGIAQLNVDSPGLIGADHYLSFASYEMMDFLTNLHAQLHFPEEIKIAPLTRDSDQSFCGVGFPGWFTIEWGPSIPKGTATIPFFWWGHTLFDTIDKFDAKRFERTAALYAAYVEALSSTTSIPYRLAPAVTALDTAIKKCIFECPSLNIWLHLETCQQELTELVHLAHQLDTTVQDRAPIEQTAILALYRDMMQLIAPTLYTASGRYHQDRYGDLRYREPAPILAPWRALAQTPPQSEDWYLLLTESLRVRNQLSDTIYKATSQLRTTLA